MNEQPHDRDPLIQGLSEKAQQWTKTSRVLGIAALFPVPTMALSLILVSRHHWGSGWLLFSLLCMLISFGLGCGSVLSGYVAHIGQHSRNATTTASMRYGVVGMLLAVLAFFILPLVMPVVPHRCLSACINNLRQLDGAKEQWMLENKKTLTDTPAMADLVGTDKYIRVTPQCPAAGTYTLGNMATKPQCSVTDHTLQ